MYVSTHKKLIPFKEYNERKGTRVFVLTEMKAASLAKEETRWGLDAL